MKYDNQLRYAVEMIGLYDGRLPLSAWLKDFFRQHRQMGSRDRKTLAEMMYSYYRLGHIPFDSVEERVLAGLAFCHTLPEILDHCKTARPALDARIASMVTENGGLRSPFLANIFPWREWLSEGMDPDAFARSFLVQPDLFLRIRPHRKEIVLRKLEAAGISYSICGDHCIALPNSTRAEAFLDINAEVVVQDRSSQQTGMFMHGLRDTGTGESLSGDARKPLAVWDCCAGGGGKSIMAFDILSEINITVSDKREYILRNLEKRFAEAGIVRYHSFVSDLTKESPVLPEQCVDLLIADVPCSGSGTWARTPEQLFFFEREKIEFYHRLQQQIVTRVIPSVKKGGYLLYITCSVFRAENEDMVEFIKEISGLQLLKAEIIRGYESNADTMFVALLRVV